MVNQYASILIIFSALIFFPACTVTQKSLVERNPDPEYDKFYPYHIELCAISKIDSHDGSVKGGIPGHAAMFLKGACWDDKAPYLAIKMCDPNEVDMTGSDAGVGVSVNVRPKNVNWIVAPGKDLFFNGYLKKSDRLTEEFREETYRKIIDLGIFKGIELHERFKKEIKPGETQEQYLARKTVGTDMALIYGRSVACSLLPVTEGMMEKMVIHLNDINLQYYKGKAEYSWSGISDNCAHLVHNALAAADVWSAKSINTYKALQMVNLSVPVNEVFDLILLTNKNSLTRVRQIYRNRVKRKSLLEHNWLPIRHGALIKSLQVHQNNDLYDKTVRVFYLKLPGLELKERIIRGMGRKKRYSDMKENLLHFQKRYEAVLKRRHDDFDSNADKDSFSYMAKKYFEYVEMQLADVNEKLEYLGN